MFVELLLRLCNFFCSENCKRSFDDNDQKKGLYREECTKDMMDINFQLLGNSLKTYNFFFSR